MLPKTPPGKTPVGGSPIVLREIKIQCFRFNSLQINMMIVLQEIEIQLFKFQSFQINMMTVQQGIDIGLLNSIFMNLFLKEYHR